MEELASIWPLMSKEEKTQYFANSLLITQEKNRKYNDVGLEVRKTSEALYLIYLKTEIYERLMAIVQENALLQYEKIELDLESKRKQLIKNITNRFANV